MVSLGNQTERFCIGSVGLEKIVEFFSFTFSRYPLSLPGMLGEICWAPLRSKAVFKGQSH